MSQAAKEKIEGQWIDAFRAGDYGDQGKFSEADVRHIASSYDPAHHEAPAVIGHPKTDAPAWGWVDRVRAVGDLLQFKMRDVQPAFAEMLDSKQFKKRSVRLYKGADGYSLRHIGFLGAQPPVVKGLADIALADEDKQAVEIEFSEEIDMADQQESLIKGIVQGLKESLGIKPAEAAKAFSEADVEAAATKAATAAAAAAVAPLQARLDTQATEFAEREKKIATSETKQRAATAIAKVKAAGAWVPAFDKADLPLIFEELATSTVTVDFGEGADKAQKPLLDRFTDFMESLGQIVPKERLANGGPGTAVVREGLPPNADPNSVQFSEAIRSRMKEKGLTFEVAMDQVAAEQPHLTRPGGASAGKV